MAMSAPVVAQRKGPVGIAPTGVAITGIAWSTGGRRAIRRAPAARAGAQGTASGHQGPPGSAPAASSP
ncbi:hypothetical protein EBO15_39895, partial [Actinomadura harenae]